MERKTPFKGCSTAFQCHELHFGEVTKNCVHVSSKDRAFAITSGEKLHHQRTDGYEMGP